MKNYIIIALLTIVTLSCKKAKADPHVPPDVELVSGTKFITADCTLGKQDSVWVGLRAHKTEDNLKSYNVSFAYDGSQTTTTFFNYLMSSNEYDNYGKDIMIVTRNVAGTEKWIFSIVDRDGNITQKAITITVQ
jgi:hypothetical protein